MQQVCVKVMHSYDNLNSKKSVVEGSNYVFKEFIKKMRENLSNDPPCPLCHRCFEDTTEVETLIDEVCVK